MPERYDLVLGPMHYVHRAINLANSINVGEHVPRQRDARLECNSVDG
eukprot:CAMPEP_0170612490 /NCGR_PEP_ID=MMETSP0224-20130122/23753_1 /TAXON_ID=285029 /ORGANISM="Togula jolla, Strain CCCM 725" /LENGTH=46 /DNA_ID= /DNA_START= /DNA_END= /DNA_ORIENTATION=